MRHTDGSSGAGSVESKLGFVFFLSGLARSALEGASSFFFVRVKDRHGLSSLWGRAVGRFFIIILIVTVSLSPMLFLHVVLNEECQQIPDGVVDHGWRVVFNNCTIFESGGLGVGRHVVLLTFCRVLDFPIRLGGVLAVIRTGVKFFITVSIEVIEINKDHLSSEHVVVLIDQLNLNLQGHLIELISSCHIDTVVHKSNVILILGSSHSRSKHPLELRFERMGMVFPLVLPPGELFFSDHDHLPQPVEFVFLSLPGVSHLLEDDAVPGLLRTDVASLLVNQMNLFLKIFFDNIEVLVVLLSKVN